MSRVITFSQVFPKSHPKAGEPTCFVEKIHSGKKIHTIRGGERFKVGDKFSPRVWSGKPYASPQLKIYEDLEVKAVYSVRILVQDFGDILGLQACISLNSKPYYFPEVIAENDGLSLDDFLNWFKTKKGETFVGQIICWSENIMY